MQRMGPPIDQPHNHAGRTKNIPKRQHQRGHERRLAQEDVRDGDVEAESV